MKLLSTAFLLLFLFSYAHAQKKTMDQSTYSLWNKIRSEAISHDGKWVKYHIVPGKGDKTLKLYNTSSKEERTFKRVSESSFTYDNQYLIYKKGAAYDSLVYKRRRKVEKKDLPGDSLVIVKLDDFSEVVVPNIGTYKIPKKWSGILAYQAKISKDTSATKMEQKFFIHSLTSGSRDTIENVDGYLIAEEGEKVVFHRSGKDTSTLSGVFTYDVASHLQQTVLQAPGSYKNVAMNKTGSRVSFVVDLDTTERMLRPYELYLHSDGETKKLVAAHERITPAEYEVTEHTKPSFSESGDVLYFGVGRLPVMPDSLSLKEENVQVEVWHSEDPTLYTMQELQADRLKKKTYRVRYDAKAQAFLPLETDVSDNVQVSDKGDGDYYMVSNRKPYGKEVTWTGRTKADYYLGSIKDGSKVLWEEALSGSPSFSPGGRYIYWFDREGQDWFTYDLEKGIKVNVTKGEAGFVDELNDRPMKAGSYGSAGWTDGDESFIIYDRYDVWRFDPSGVSPSVNLTNSRSAATSWRIADLDREEDVLNEDAFAYIFNESTKESGYGRLNLVSEEKSILRMEAMTFRRVPMKAKNADLLVFSKGNFQEFPDLYMSNMDLGSPVKFSMANPQQADYKWGTIEIFKWKDYEGMEVEGLLVKPEDFDPLKKYPVIVNFYERSSNGLHRHRAPEPHRSTINYSYYASKGYVIFNPDVRYEIGEPGASAYNAVVSGVEALSKNQFVDQERIGVQGHSWGGYQIAHLLNKTNIFKCAESGAPVVNMVSAYGGIRWGSGMSRMFQYEKTQSRLGATLWEDREVYLRNSPIFEMDKMDTPVLILHNDNDGAVPWYQGIEYFMALRRLGKPAWFLNYNGEPHWPLKWNNRLDFNKRMEQFFDHYLMGEAMPKWMMKGVNVVDKGVNQGFELEK